MPRAAVVLLVLILFLRALKGAAQLRLPALPDSSRTIFSVKPLPQNFYNQELSFFCRQELRLQKLTALPLYFRVGAKGYVDYLEKKPNAAKPQQ